MSTTVINSITIEPHTGNNFVVHDTASIRNHLAALRGKFTPNISDGQGGTFNGWVYPNDIRADIETKITNLTS